MTIMRFRIAAVACSLSALALAATAGRFRTPLDATCRLAASPHAGRVFPLAGAVPSAPKPDGNAAPKRSDSRGWTGTTDGDGVPYALAFSPLGDGIAVVGSDGMVTVLGASTGKRLLGVAQRSKPSSEATSCCGVAYSPDGQWIASSCDNNSVGMWRSRTGEKGRRFSAPWAGPTTSTGDLYSPAVMAFSPDGRVLAARWDKGNKNVVELFDVASGKPLSSLPLPEGTDSGMPDTGGWAAFSPDGATLAVSYSSKLITLWDVRTGKKVRDFAGHEGAVSGVSFSPDGRLLVSSAGYWGDRSISEPPLPEATIKLWDVATGRTLLTLAVAGQTDNPCSVVFLPDGRCFASGGEDHMVRLWETATGKELLRWDVGSIVIQVAASPDGRSLAAALQKHAVRLLPIDPPQEDQPPSPDGREFGRLWDDLGEGHAGFAYGAVRTLSSAAGDVASRIGKRLHRVYQVRPEELTRLIADLDADSFDRREAATKELAALGAQAGPALRKTLEETTSAEVRSRVKPLVKALDEWVVTDPDTLRALRAIWVLERIGTPQARAVLEDLAKGAPEVRQTQEAKAALDFLDKRAAAQTLTGK